MPQAPECAGVHQPFDIHRDFFAKIAFNLVIMFNDFPELDNLIFAEILDTNRAFHPGLLQNPKRRGSTDPIDISKTDIGPLVSRQINSSYTRHINPLSWPGSRIRPTRPLLRGAIPNFPIAHGMRSCRSRPYPVIVPLTETDAGSACCPLSLPLLMARIRT